MPSHEQTKCLIDIASGEVLKEAMEQEIRGEFIDWQRICTYCRREEKLVMRYIGNSNKDKLNGEEQLAF